MDTLTQKAMIAASGYFLTEHFPEDFNSMSEDDINTFMSDNVWQPLENWDVKDVYQHIESLAETIRDFHKQH